MAQVKLTVKEIYALLCSDCQKRLEELVKSKLSDQVVKQALGAKGK